MCFLFWFRQNGHRNLLDFLFDVKVVNFRFFQAIIYVLHKFSFCVALVPPNFINLGDIVELLKFLGIVDTYVAEFVN